MSKFNYIYSDPTISTPASGSTPYGTYDNDASFVTESVDMCKWVARRLGHPVMQLEFNSGSIYAMFEEAVSEYSLHINHYNMKNWMWESYGSDTKVSGSGWSNNSENRMGTGSVSVTHPHMGTTFLLSDQYGEAIGIGGTTTMHTGSITITGSKQVYDLQTESNLPPSHEGKRLEIQTVFNQGPSSITRFYDPFTGNYDQRNMLDSFGMGNVSPAVSFILRPVSHDITRAQAIETNDIIRKSAYSFELINNQLRVFPVPESDDTGNKIFFKYYVKEDRQSTTSTFTNNRVTDPSNVPYKFITYSEINAPGRQWIRKFALALSKELLGIIRSKYASLPLPNGEVAMDGESLKAEGREEKAQMLEELKEFLDSVSLSEKSRHEQEQAESAQQVLSKAPLGVYIG
jgi:hypothetical protein